jgi:hypothetical protein
MTSGAAGTPWEQPHHDAGPAASRRSLYWFYGKRERERERERERAADPASHREDG